ncbi:hypothetical protein Tco_0814947 [Tanacetum coccineum]
MPSAIAVAIAKIVMMCNIFEDWIKENVLGYEDWRGAVADINEDGFCRFLYHSWFNREGFNDLIRSELHNLCPLASHVKLKALKQKLKSWHINNSSKESSFKLNAIKTLQSLDAKIEAGNATSEDRDHRLKLLQEIDKLDNLEAMDSIQ